MEALLRIPFVSLARAIRQRKVEPTAAGYARSPTPADRIGPAYRAGAPLRSNIVPERDPHQRLILQGKVLSARTGQPLPGALLDVWQASARGIYSDLLGVGPRLKRQGMAFRGRLHASEDGSYRIETIVPGHYPLGPFSRPRHIHLLITHPDATPLVTQLYFEGDPLLSQDRFATPSLQLNPRPDGSALRAHFDFVLTPGC